MSFTTTDFAQALPRAALRSPRVEMTHLFRSTSCQTTWTCAGTLATQARCRRPLATRRAATDAAGVADTSSLCGARGWRQAAAGAGVWREGVPHMVTPSDFGKTIHCMSAISCRCNLPVQTFGWQGAGTEHGLALGLGVGCWCTSRLGSLGSRIQHTVPNPGHHLRCVSFLFH